MKFRVYLKKEILLPVFLLVLVFTSSSVFCLHKDIVSDGIDHAMIARYIAENGILTPVYPYAIADMEYGVIKQMYPVAYPQLSFVVMSFFYMFGGETGLKFFTPFFVILASLFIYLLISRATKYPSIGFVSDLFMITPSFGIFTGLYIKPMYLAMAFACLYFYYMSMKKASKKSFVILAGITLGMVVATKQQEEYKEYPDPGDPEKKILIADVRMKIRGCKEPVRIVLLPNENEKKEKDRFYPIYTNDKGTPVYDLLVEYRSRQNHELCYRVMTHDLSLDALPKSYPLNPKVENVQFHDKHVMLVGWIKALAFNIISDFKECLDRKYHSMTVGKIVRKFIDRPATIKTTAAEIIIKFDYFRECNALKEYCDKINKSNLEISWFKDKVLRFEFESEEEFKKRKSFLSTG